MNKFTQVVKNFWNDEEGLTAVEYAVAGGLVVAGLVGAFSTLGGSVKNIITGLNTSLTSV